MGFGSIDHHLVIVGVKSYTEDIPWCPNSRGSLSPSIMKPNFVHPILTELPHLQLRSRDIMWLTLLSRSTDRNKRQLDD